MIGLSGPEAVANESDDPYTAWCFDDACNQWGQYIENALAHVEYDMADAESRKRTNELNRRRSQVLQSILSEDDDGVVRQQTPDLVLVNKVDVPGRTRPPQADDPEDPYGLWDKTPPPPPPKGKFKDPVQLAEQLGTKWASV